MELDPARDVDVDRIAADRTDVPAPVDWDEPREHGVTLRTRELVAEIEPGVTFKYMTFEGQVPGPMIRVRRGDIVNLRFEVPADDNSDLHNVDFHAVYGPGGGAVDTTLVPGDDAAEVRFRAAYPGLFTYHCAVPAMDHHVRRLQRRPARRRDRTWSVDGADVARFFVARLGRPMDDPDRFVIADARPIRCRPGSLLPVFDRLAVAFGRERWIPAGWASVGEKRGSRRPVEGDIELRGSMASVLIGLVVVGCRVRLGAVDRHRPRGATVRVE
nr:multicopper oxidase domain-containing protein [Halobellus captivus]